MAHKINSDELTPHVPHVLFEWAIDKLCQEQDIQIIIKSGMSTQKNEH